MARILGALGHPISTVYATPGVLLFCAIAASLAVITVAVFICGDDHGSNKRRRKRSHHRGGGDVGGAGMVAEEEAAVAEEEAAAVVEEEEEEVAGAVVAAAAAADDVDCVRMGLMKNQQQFSVYYIFCLLNNFIRGLDFLK
uniref:Uncharacterized protein n=1 Tax=Ananas comosus var. bracteatus TaxID=296719 RepID=A0A6V7P747_ANACO|nr:unnamed protein product [Ananas comosus var. bracteatus]